MTRADRDWSRQRPYPPTVIDLEPSLDLRFWATPDHPTGWARLVARPSAWLSNMSVSPVAVRAQRHIHDAAAGLATAGRPIGAALHQAARSVFTLAVATPAPRAARLLGRLVRGEPLNGLPRTDCSFRRPGRRQLPHVDGHSAPWSYMSGIERLAVRWYLTCDAYAAAHALWPAETRTALIAIGVLGAVWAAYLGRGLSARRRHRRRYLIPLHHALLREVLRIPIADPNDWLHFPPDYSHQPHEIGRITLPPQASQTMQDQITAIVCAKLALPLADIRADYQLAGNTPRVTFLRRASCPSRVLFADWRHRIEQCKPGEIFIGLANATTPYIGSFLTDDPHWGFECGSRRGKSTFLSLTAAQIMHQDPDATCTGIDVKRESFKALFGVPRLTLSNDPRDVLGMWDTIAAFRAEMDRRCDARAQDPTLEFSFNLLLIDEVSQFAAQSRQLWSKMRTRADPPQPPVWDDIAAVMWQGAAFRCHAVIAGQRVDHTVTGGIGLIGSMGFRGLAGFRPQNWQRLIGTRPIPRSRPERGRWIYSDGNAETWVQNVWATDEEINNYARSPRAPRRAPTTDAGRDTARTTETGTVYLTSAAVGPVSNGTYASGQQQPTRGTSQMSYPPLGHTIFPSQGPAPTPTTPGTPKTSPAEGPAAGTGGWSPRETEPPAGDPRRLLGLREAVERGIVSGIGLQALRKRRARDPEFPPARGRRGSELLHDIDELAAWAQHKATEPGTAWS